MSCAGPPQADPPPVREVSSLPGGGGAAAGLPGAPASWVGWRTKRLRAAGFSPALAHQLACESRIDLHALLELVDRHCRPDLAARILAPLDWEPERR